MAETVVLAGAPIYGKRRPVRGESVILVRAHPRKRSRGVRPHLRKLREERDMALHVYEELLRMLGARNDRTGDAYAAYLDKANAVNRAEATE